MIWGTDKASAETSNIRRTTRSASAYACVARLVAVLACAMAACGGEQRRESPLMSRSATPRQRALPVFEVLAPYTASMLHGVEHADPEHEENRVAEGLPAMLRAFQARSPNWLRSPYHQHIDATFVPHRACAYRDVPFETFLECVRRVLPARDAGFALEALRAYHVLAAQQWRQWSGYLGPIARELSRKVQGREGQELSEILFGAAGVDPFKLPRFQIVLVRQPPGSRLLGAREERTLVLAIGGDRSVASLAETAFHELAHYAVQYSSRVERIEIEFQNFGDIGAIAANHWNEALATAFGQGLAASRLNPRFCFQRSMYGNETVDALAHALYLVWRGDPYLELGPTFARRFVNIAKESWPPNKWQRSDFLARAEVYAPSSGALDTFQDRMRAQRFWGRAPIPAHFSRDPQAPPMVARIILATPGDLKAAPWVTQSLGITADDLRRQPGHTGKAELWRRQPNGARLILVLGRTPNLLNEAIVHFWAKADARPSEGWAEL